MSYIIHSHHCRSHVTPLHHYPNTINHSTILFLQLHHMQYTITPYMLRGTFTPSSGCTTCWRLLCTDTCLLIIIKKKDLVSLPIRHFTRDKMISPQRLHVEVLLCHWLLLNHYLDIRYKYHFCTSMLTVPLVSLVPLFFFFFFFDAMTTDVRFKYLNIQI